MKREEKTKRGKSGILSFECEHLFDTVKNQK